MNRTWLTRFLKNKYISNTFNVKPQILLALVCVILYSFYASSHVFAQDVEKYITVKDQVIESDIVKAGERIVISNTTIDGDAYLIGSNVDFQGTVTGDLIIISGDAHISGNIGQDLRIISKDVFINGKVQRNISLIAGSAFLEKKHYSGSLVSIVFDITNNADFEKGIKILGGTVFLNGSSDREIKIAAKRQLILGPQFANHGRLFYSSPKPAHIDESAHINGPIVYDNNKRASSYPSVYIKNIFSLTAFPINTGINGFKLFVFLLFFSVGYILVSFYPKLFISIIRISKSSLVKHFFKGVFILLLMVAAVIFLAASIIGLPLVLLFLLVLPVIFMFMIIVGSFIVGRNTLLALSAGDRRGWALFIGLFIAYFFSSIKTLSFIYVMSLLFISTGVIAEYIVYLTRNRKKHKTGRK